MAMYPCKMCKSNNWAFGNEGEFVTAKCNSCGNQVKWRPKAKVGVAKKQFIVKKEPSLPDGYTRPVRDPGQLRDYLPEGFLKKKQ